MKRNIYSYSKLWMIFFVLMGAACTNQVEDAIPVSGQSIEFSVQSDWKEIPNTRSNPGKTHLGAKDTIQIFGFHKSSSGDVKKFMYRVGEPARGQKVVFDSISNKWNYSPKRFWPKKDSLFFYAGYPEYSVLYKEENLKMTYEQPDFNPLGLDLLWGVSALDCAKDRNTNVVIKMKHALAKVNISFSGFSDEIGSVIVLGYKTGWFPRKIEGGIPEWHVDDKTNNIDVVFYKYKNQIINNSVTVFILPDKITGLQVWNVKGDKKIADASVELQQPQYTFLAGKEYNLRISKGVQKKNTNSRSIAMSVRCVSE